MKSALSRRIQKLKVFEDSLLVYYMDEEATQLLENTLKFDQITFSRIQRELNTEADSLSKQGIVPAPSFIWLEEYTTRVLTETQQTLESCFYFNLLVIM